MGKDITILQAIKMVMDDEKKVYTAKEVYLEILNRNLYTFKAKDAVQVVNHTIRTHCINLEFPSARPDKHFIMADKKGKQCYYALKDWKNSIEQKIAEDDSDTSELIQAEGYLPEELIGKLYGQHLEDLKEQLLENILSSEPAFFESLVVELLLKMGYGYDQDSGIVTGSHNDGGIDGIISEDKLGLDKIYLQAKRYAISHKIGRPKVQEFIGAMGSTGKGVFITTSDFTEKAKEWLKEHPDKRVILMNGKMLTDLMIKFEVGVRPTKVLKIYRVDEDFFE